MTPEGTVKTYLKEQCEERGWKCLSLVDPTRRAWPDRTILAPNTSGRVGYVEVKAEGVRHPKAHINRQLKRIAELRHDGYFAEMVTGNEAVDACLVRLARYFESGIL